MNGTTRSAAIASAVEQADQRRPIEHARQQRRARAPSRLMPSAVTTPVSAIVEPTDRSMPPLTMIIVMPIAPIATMTVCDRTIRG